MADATSRARTRLAAGGIDRPSREALLIVGLVLEWSEAQVLARSDLRLASEHGEAIDALAERRARGCPFAYLAGRREFFGRTFQVDSRVLIPRPETEHAVEAVLSLEDPARRIIDLGTGSGCIALTVALERRGVFVLATDRSLPALAVARTNARRFNQQDLTLASRVRFACTDLSSAVDISSFDTVVSNPPYIASSETLPATVWDHEPHQALFAGVDGLSFYRRLLGSATPFHQNQRVILELGANQRDAVIALAEPAFEVLAVISDLSGWERTLVLRKA